MADVRQCHSCDSFRTGRAEWGECHHDSPVIIQSVPAKSGRHIGQWPAVKQQWSCSRWFGTITLKELDEDT